MEKSYRTSQTSKLELFTIKVSAYSQKQCSQKVLPYMFEKILKTLTLRNTTPPNY